jgi:hypothetical protein
MEIFGISDIVCAIMNYCDASSALVLTRVCRRLDELISFKKYREYIISNLENRYTSITLWGEIVKNTIEYRAQTRGDIYRCMMWNMLGHMCGIHDVSRPSARLLMSEWYNRINKIDLGTAQLYLNISLINPNAHKSRRLLESLRELLIEEFSDRLDVTINYPRSRTVFHCKLMEYECDLFKNRKIIENYYTSTINILQDWACRRRKKLPYRDESALILITAHGGHVQSCIGGADWLDIFETETHSELIPRKIVI